MENSVDIVIDKQPQELSTNPQDIHTDVIHQAVWAGDSCTLAECEHYKAWLRAQMPQKAPAVPGAGRPCKYCENKEKYNKLVSEFVDKHSKLGVEKVTIPWVEDLALALGVLDTRINDWVKKVDKDGEPEHPELIDAIEKLKMIQRLRLQQRVLGRYNPTGAIFLLKANHGYMETEKKVITGDSKEPLLIEIINEKKGLSDE